MTGTRELKKATSTRRISDSLAETLKSLCDFLALPCQVSWHSRWPERAVCPSKEALPEADELTAEPWRSLAAACRQPAAGLPPHAKDHRANSLPTRSRGQPVSRQSPENRRIGPQTSTAPKKQCPQASPPPAAGLPPPAAGLPPHAKDHRANGLSRRCRGQPASWQLRENRRIGPQISTQPKQQCPPRPRAQPQPK